MGGVNDIPRMCEMLAAGQVKIAIRITSQVEKKGDFGRVHLLLFLQRFFNLLLESRKASLPEKLPVDEDCGGSPNIGLPGVFHIFIYHGRNGRVLQIAIELFHIQSQFPGDLLDLGITEVSLVGVQLGVELPKFPLFRGREGGDGGLVGEIVAWEGELLNHQPYFFWILLQHLLEERLKPRAVGSLIIREDNDDHRGILRPFKRPAGHVNGIGKIQEKNLKRVFR
jgi:hypothetical protein